MDSSVEQKLVNLYKLQFIHSKIDKIRTIRGELPMEVNDLEDDVAGLTTRINKLKDEIDELEDMIVIRKNNMKQAQALVKKYEGQQKNVKNNREFEALAKEIEIEGLEIQISEKKIKEHQVDIEFKNETLSSSAAILDERKKDLEHKEKELQSIIEETEKEENLLLEKAKVQEVHIEPRLLTAYDKLRANAHNGLAVVTIARDSCAGCFNKIPPQRRADIRQRKKIIICEHCGRIIIDEALANQEEESTILNES